MSTLLTSGKLHKLERVSNRHGVIAAMAMDQRGSLRSAIAKADGFDKGSVTPQMMSEFKEAVVRILTPHASAVLLDPEYGREASRLRARECGLLLACERSGYEEARLGRLPRLLEHWTVRRLVGEGADCIKALLYYDPFEVTEINDIKHCWVERIGAECLAADVPFFLELVGYGDSLDVHGLEYARRKPEVVRQSLAEFSKPEYRVDVLKIEIPVNLSFVKGARACHGEAAYTREEAKKHFQATAAEARKPFIYLSAGVTLEIFVESLELAAESGAPFSGVLCGRATWQEGIAIYARKGLKELEDWLAVEGVRNIRRINQAIEAAKSWGTFYAATTLAANVGKA